MTLLKPVEQKGHRVPIIIQENMDREINRLIKKNIYQSARMFG